MLQIKTHKSLKNLVNANIRKTTFASENYAQKEWLKNMPAIICGHILSRYSIIIQHFETGQQVQSTLDSQIKIGRKPQPSLLGTVLYRQLHSR